MKTPNEFSGNLLGFRNTTSSVIMNASGKMAH